MSIENSLERIATALENLDAGFAGSAARTKPEAKPEPEEEPEKEPEPEPKPKATRSKKAKKVSVDMVRGAVHAYQNVTSADKAKELLKKYGGLPLSKLSEDKYQDVIDEAKELTEEAKAGAED